MLMVVFGAGASYDSLPGRAGGGAYCPPLAADLFKSEPFYLDALNRYEQATSAADRVLGGMKRGGTLETELERFVGDAAEWPAIHMSLMALRFYLRSVLWQCSDQWGAMDGGKLNYVRLVRELEQWRHKRDTRIAYVTFNYDTLLEQALRRVVNLSFITIDRYVSEERGVFKVHGSVDWGQAVVSERFANYAGPAELIELAPYLKFEDRFEKVNSVDSTGGPPQFLAPAIAMPVVEKTQFALPTEHLDLLRTWLPDVRRLLVVGWRGNEQLFLRFLRESELGKDTPVEIVTSSDVGAKETEGHLQSAGIQGPVYHHLDGFSAFMGGTGFDQLMARLKS